MGSKMMPDYMFSAYADVTPEFLRSIGARALLLDIDNTLAPYEQPEPDESLSIWFRALSDAGIRCALISNNKPPRAERFNATLGLPVYTESAKPRKKGFLLAMRELGVTPEETAVLGDQLLADALGGKRCGCTTLIVPPIKDKTTLFFRVKRRIERPFYRKYMKSHPEFRYPGLSGKGGT